jgi:hypothetical protein
MWVKISVVRYILNTETNETTKRQHIDQTEKNVKNIAVFVVFGGVCCY